MCIQSSHQHLTLVTELVKAVRFDLGFRVVLHPFSKQQAASSSINNNNNNTNNRHA